MLSPTFYWSVLGIGILYLFIAFFSDLEFLVGRFFFGLPYALLSWGILGLLGTSDLNAFLVGFLPVLIILGLLYTMLHSEGFDPQNLILHEGIVNVAIPVKDTHRGEIRVEDNGTNRFLVAKAYDPINKPIPKGSKVRIIEVEGQIALVSEEIQIPKGKSPSQRKSDGLFRFINSITPKSKVTGVCMICFGQLISSRKGFTCPSCQAVAHIFHIDEWVKIKGYCPNCRTNLSFDNGKIINKPGNKMDNPTVSSKSK
ncbi:MAG: hypothetical protein INQ03_24670 [Candidatus Heimdallarchaeota archaeon]|nr:hypothetical protein [Candidatus Heimdallarchaeota archaeon]